MNPHEIWPKSFKNGLVLYASSATPIPNAKVEAAIKPINSVSPNMCSLEKREAKKRTTTIKVKYRLTPPSEGLEVLLQRTTTSFLLRIPRFFAKLSINLLMTKETINAPIKKELYSNK